jgi:hypothetical protein
MVGIGQNDLRPRGADLMREKRLDRGLCSNWHERRRLDDAMGRRHPAAAGAAARIGGEQLELELTRCPLGS